MNVKPKVVCGVGDLLGCGYYRMKLPYKHLSKLGFDVHLTNKLDMELNPQDVLVLQRQHHDNVLAISKDFKNRGGRLVFELDDYFHDLPPNNPARTSYPVGGKELKNLEAFMEISDLMTVSTPALAENYSKWAKNVHVCYNSIDLEDISNLPEKPIRTDDSIHLGWAGSATHLDDLLPIVKPIVEIMVEYPKTKFVFVGMDYRKIFPRDLQNRLIYGGHTFPVDENGKGLFYDINSNPVLRYYHLLQQSSIDIAIAPLLNVKFNRAKSYIKLLEYGIANIPFVATDYGPYSQYVLQHREKQLGFLAETNSNWKRALKRLIEDTTLRNNITKNNYDTVIKHHTMNTGIDEWIKALASIDVHPDLTNSNYTENIVKIN